MVNHAIHICLSENIRGRLNLRNRIYRDFRERYDVVSCYAYNVAEIAWSVVKRHKKWNRNPFVKHLMLKVDRFNYSLNYSILSLPSRKNHRILIPLKYGGYQRSFLLDATLRRGSVTMTDSTIIITFKRKVQEIEVHGKVGFDCNENSLVGFTSDGTLLKYDTSQASCDRAQYRMIRSKIAKELHDDRRVGRRLLDKYGRKERGKVNQLLHKISKTVVEYAKRNQYGIVLEDLKGIRRRLRRGNHHGRNLRSRLNAWSFRELQRQIEYKAKWDGMPVSYVNAAHTSQTCSICGSMNKDLRYERVWQCPSCGAILDRDVNAAKNILAKSIPIPVRAVAVRPSGEGR